MRSLSSFSDDKQAFEAWATLSIQFYGLIKNWSNERLDRVLECDTSLIHRF